MPNISKYSANAVPTDSSRLVSGKCCGVISIRIFVLLKNRKQGIYEFSLGLLVGFYLPTAIHRFARKVYHEKKGGKLRASRRSSPDSEERNTKIDFWEVEQRFLFKNTLTSYNLALVHICFIFFLYCWLSILYHILPMFNCFKIISLLIICFLFVVVSLFLMFFFF